MEGQICEIKKQSRFTGHKTNTDFLTNNLFKDLVRHITFKAFNLICQEMEYLSKRGENAEKCGCYLRRTHGLPCAHELQMFITYGYNIPLGQIDEYWKTLDMEFSRTSTNATYDDDGGSSNATDDDGGHTGNYLLAETEDICAPPPVEQKKKLGSIRVPSAWERVMRSVGLKKSSSKKGKGRVAGTNASQDSPDDISQGSRMSISDGTRMSISQGSRMSFSQGQGHITPTSPSTPKTPTSKPPRSPASVVVRRKSSARKSNFKKRNNGPFQFLGSVVEEQFPPYMKNYINQCTNVLGDGNCGFRAVALAIYGSEDEWVKVRRDMLDDLRSRSQLYHNVIGGVTTLSELDDRISHFDGPAPPDKWMTLPECGHVVATTYNVVFMSFSDIGGCTCLPATLDRTRGPPIMKVVLGNMDNNSHWILLHMAPGDHPVPPIALFWEDHHHSSADGLDTQFQYWIDQYKVLHNADTPRRAARFSSNF